MCCYAPGYASASSLGWPSTPLSSSAPGTGGTFHRQTARRPVLPLHPHLLTLIGDYRTAHVHADNPLLPPRENGRPLDRHTVTRMINKAGTARQVRPTSTRTNYAIPWPHRSSTAVGAWKPSPE